MTHLAYDRNFWWDTKPRSGCLQFNLTHSFPPYFHSHRTLEEWDKHHPNQSFDQQANQCTVAEPRPIPTLDEHQLEQLARLKECSDGKSSRITTAIERIEAWMDPVLNDYNMLVGIRTWLIRLRWRLLPRLDTGAETDAELEQDIWNEVL